MKNKGLRVRAAGKRLELWIYDTIGADFFGGVSAKAVAEEVKNAGKVGSILVHLNSPGGDVFDGLAIYNTLRKHKAKVTVEIDGLAASIASIIALAGDTVRMAENATYMIHDPWTYTVGNAAELRDMAERLDTVRGTLFATYKAKAPGLADDELDALMANETWMTAQQALSHGLVDEVAPALTLAAGPRFDLSKFKNAPQPAKDTYQAPENELRRAGIARMAAEVKRLQTRRNGG